MRPPWICPPHRCEACDPEGLAVPEHPVNEGHLSWRGDRPPSGHQVEATVDGLLVPYFIEVVPGVRGWIDACGMLPGLTFPEALHLCPCVGRHQCFRRVHGFVSVRFTVRSCYY
jgi:hypothetical protein